MAPDSRSRGFPLLRVSTGFLGVAAGFSEKTPASDLPFFRHAKAARLFLDGAQAAHSGLADSAAVPHGRRAGFANHREADSHRRSPVVMASVDKFLFGVGRDFRCL